MKLWRITATVIVHLPFEDEEVDHADAELALREVLGDGEDDTVSIESVEEVEP